MKSDERVPDPPIILPSKLFPLLETMQLEDTTPFADCDGGLITLLPLRISEDATPPANRDEASSVEVLPPPPDEYRSGDFGFGMLGPKSNLLNCCGMS